MSEWDDRVAIKAKQDAVVAALLDLLTVQPLTEAHLFVVTQLSSLGGAVASDTPSTP